MKFSLTALIIGIITATGYSQGSDFIILKRKNKTATSYFSGNNIAFVTASGSAFDCLIKEIRNDSLYLQEFVTQRVLTVFGTIVLDTIGSFHHKFHYTEIKVIGYSKRQNFNWRGSGAALLGGGTLLTLGSAVVYLADREKFSAPLLIGSAALGTLGYFMAKGKSGGIVIGKKYRLQYMNMSPRVN